MRRMLFVLGLLCIASIVSAQQTYYYKHTKTIDKYGVVSKGSDGSYITFTNSVMYFSNAEGEKTNTSGNTYDTTYFYRGEINGCYWYMMKYSGYNWRRRMFDPLYEIYWNEGCYCLVSKDFSAVNVVYDGAKAFTSNGIKIENLLPGKDPVYNTSVYTRSSAPKPGDDIPGLIR